MADLRKVLEISFPDEGVFFMLYVCDCALFILY